MANAFGVPLQICRTSANPLECLCKFAKPCQMHLECLCKFAKPRQMHLEHFCKSAGMRTRTRWHLCKFTIRCQRSWTSFCRSAGMPTRTRSHLCTSAKALRCSLARFCRFTTPFPGFGARNPWPWVACCWVVARYYDLQIACLRCFLTEKRCAEALFCLEIWQSKRKIVSLRSDNN